MIIQHPYSFFLGIFILSAMMGAWLSWLFLSWRVRKLEKRLELCKSWPRPGPFKTIKDPGDPQADWFKSNTKARTQAHL